MKVIIELEVENCSDCPNYNYEGTSWSEDVYTCKKLNCEVNGKGIPNNCPFIESTMEQLRKHAVSNRYTLQDMIDAYDAGVWNPNDETAKEYMKRKYNVC